MTDTTRGRLRYAAKLLLGLGLLAALLLMDQNWRKVLDLAKQARPAYLLPFFGVSVALIGVSCLKWRLFLRGRSVDLSMIRLMGLYLIGYFFNNFFPSNFGGDTVRSYILGRQIGSQERALATVFLERFTGFIAMVTLAVVAFLFSPALRQEPLTKWSILVMGGGLIGVLVVIFWPGVLGWFVSPFRRFDLIRSLEQKAARFHGHITHFRGEYGLVARAMIYSYAFYAFAAVNVYYAGLLLGVECSLPQLFVVTPIVMLLAAFPLTPNSLGIWEWGFSVYLTSAGAAPEQGLAIALALRGKNLVISLLGGGLFLLEPETYGGEEVAEGAGVARNESAAQPSS